MIAFILGIITGFITCIPIGPINIAVMMKGLHNRTVQGLMIGAGSGFMDIIYCSAAMFGVSSVISNPTLELIFRLATFAIFFIYGLRSLFLKVSDPHISSPEKESEGFKRYFLLGIVLYLSNPSFIAYWITVAGVIQGYGVIEATFYNSLFFAIGTGVGTTAWFATLLALVERQKMRFEHSTIVKITRIFGVILLAISSVMGFDLLFFFSK